MAMDVPPNFSRGGLAWELPTGAKPASARWTWGWVKIGDCPIDLASFMRKVLIKLGISMDFVLSSF